VKEILADDSATATADGPSEEKTTDEKITKEEVSVKDIDEITQSSEIKKPIEGKKLEPKEIDEIPVAEISIEESKEEQDKKPENLESTEIFKVENLEKTETEKKDESESPKPLEIIRTAKNKYQFIGDIAPAKEENQKDKLALALNSGLPETFEDELFDWPEDVDPVYREIFDKLKKKEERL